MKRAYCYACGTAVNLDLVYGRMADHHAIGRIKCPGSGQTPNRADHVPDDVQIARRRPLMPGAVMPKARVQ